MNPYPLNEKSRTVNMNFQNASAATFQERRLGPSDVLPGIIFGVYFLSLWNPPWFDIPMRWFGLLALAIFCILIQRRLLDIKGSSLYWIVQGLMFIGAILALIRAPNFDQALYNTVTMGIGMITFILFLPVLSSRIARKILLFILIFTALLWVVEVQRRLAFYGVISTTLFMTSEDNKNRISMLMAEAATALLAAAVLWRPGIATKKLNEWLGRAILIVVGFYTIYTLSLTYSRSQLIVTATGVLSVLLIWVWQTKGTIRIARFALGLGMIVGFVYFALPRVLIASPDWERMAEPVMNIQDEDSLVARRILLQKALTIISENPVLGIGAGNTRNAYFTGEKYLQRGLTHNDYLAIWAELGIFGIIGFILFAYAYIRFTRQNFAHLNLTDQIWMVVYIPYFVALVFINAGGTSQVMLTLLCGMYYEQYMYAHRRTKDFVSDTKITRAMP